VFHRRVLAADARKSGQTWYAAYSLQDGDGRGTKIVVREGKEDQTYHCARIRLREALVLCSALSCMWLRMRAASPAVSPPGCQAISKLTSPSNASTCTALSNFDIVSLSHAPERWLRLCERCLRLFVLVVEVNSFVVGAANKPPIGIGV
jgi:hypothetical protein